MKDRKPLETRIVSIDSLVPHPRNYKIHPQKQIKKLIADIKRFGQVKPIVIQAGPEGNIIVAGHGFTEAAKQAGLTELSTVVLPPTWSSDDAVGYLVSDNETERDSEIDETALQELLEEQKNAGFDLASLGFDEDAFTDMVAKMTPPTLDELTEEYGDEPEHDAFWPVIRVKVSPETKELYDSLMEDAEGSNESLKFAWMLERVNVAVEDEVT